MLLDRRERVRDGVGENERDERFFLPAQCPKVYAWYCYCCSHHELDPVERVGSMRVPLECSSELSVSESSESDTFQVVIHCECGGSFCGTELMTGTGGGLISMEDSPTRARTSFSLV